MTVTLWGSIHRNEDHAVTAAVRVYVPEDQGLLPVDELRLAHQVLVAAAAEVLNSMADLASGAVGASARMDTSGGVPDRPRV